MPSGIYPHPPAVDRFWRKVTKHENGCWEWQARVDKDGYGLFSVTHIRTDRVSRFAYEHFNSAIIPEGLQIDHLCRNRKCVNPEHLEIVTRKENRRRGAAPGGILYLKTTHCYRGHAYDEANTYINPTSGQRFCRTCHRDYERRRKHDKAKS